VVFLLSALALSTLHAALADCPSSSDCVACRTLHAPVLMQAPGPLGTSLPPVGSLVVQEIRRPASDPTPLLKSLRAPPALSIA